MLFKHVYKNRYLMLSNAMRVLKIKEIAFKNGTRFFVF